MTCQHQHLMMNKHIDYWHGPICSTSIISVSRGCHNMYWISEYVWILLQNVWDGSSMVFWIRYICNTSHPASCSSLRLRTGNLAIAITCVIGCYIMLHICYTCYIYVTLCYMYDWMLHCYSTDLTWVSSWYKS